MGCAASAHADVGVYGLMRELYVVPRDDDRADRAERNDAPAAGGYRPPAPQRLEKWRGQARKRSNVEDELTGFPPSH